MSYGKTLREAREQRKLTQAQLARMVCVEPRVIDMMEHGLHYPSYSLMLLISCTLNGGIR